MAETSRWPTARMPRAIPPLHWWVDGLLLLALAAAAYGLMRGLARAVEPSTAPAAIDLSLRSLPIHAGLSTLRMAIAYLVSLAFALCYARLAASSRAAERFLIPLLDILQSVPILAFMPGVVLGLTALVPGRQLGLELAAIVLIFTSQAWNITFSFYQSLGSIPKELREVADIHHLRFWHRFTRLELPAGAVGLIWNSMLSWAGGWFFLMASEQFTLGDKDFRLPGLGSYLQEAANQGDVWHLLAGLLALVAIIVLMNQLLWHPLTVWAERFRLGQTGEAGAPGSAVLTALRRSRLLRWLGARALRPFWELLDSTLARPPAQGRPRRGSAIQGARPRWRQRMAQRALVAFLLLGAGYGSVSAMGWLARELGPLDWRQIGLAAGATLLRTTAALAIAALWTIPVGVAIGLHPRWARVAQPIVQVAASTPATALFPILLLVFLKIPGGLSVGAVVLMVLGIQWYILFNVIGGATAIPADLREAAAIYKLRGWERWRKMILPGILPYLVTGLLTATGGAWNASVVAEYVAFGGRKESTLGLGALIAGAADRGQFALLLAATLAMAGLVLVINRLLWRRLQVMSERRFRLE